ncbi:MAG TPA: multicopper oxidase domain-containing protein [Nitrososphaeraceae archaeon]|nr:multicopper oxidase domain-containing protein [Nitrososphaeraceae archaeon]
MILPSLNQLRPSFSEIVTKPKQISTEQYDIVKNCTTQPSKKPSSIEYLTYFNCGHVSKDANGRTIRQFTLIVQEHQKIPISYEGHVFDGWTYNGTIPGPTIRVTEGDLVRIRVINSNDNSHPHSLHLQSIHYAKYDGVSMGGYPGGAISPGRSFTYEFVAQPYGVYPYHCHVDPVADYINRGLYGAMIIDPKEPRPQMTEMAMTLNGYDINYEKEGHAASEFPINQQNDTGSIMAQMSLPSLPSSNEKNVESRQDMERDNEIYSVNGKAFDYVKHPIMLQTGKLYRIYIVNMLEFDLVNSFHIHGTMFDYYTAGTDETSDYNTDIVTMSQGNRGIMEFRYDYPGVYMFHAHQTEFMDLGWMGLFDVRGDPVETNIIAGNT